MSILGLAMTARLEGQRLRPAEFPPFRPRVLMLQQPDTSPKPEVYHGETYTWEGVVLGGLVFGALGARLSDLCGLSDQPGGCGGAMLIGVLGGATIGAVVGGIIGSGIEKGP
ncbi:MAG TPA: hypothetical protein VLB49_17250 [Gemmatimonadales bacterium]|nr:hypothetical protein [Gemmatimonadales bacterium]